MLADVVAIIGKEGVIEGMIGGREVRRGGK
jgi:hypothetical protein